MKLLLVEDEEMLSKSISKGLGLAVVKMILDKHGGKISVESRTGRGTQFEVRLKIFE